MNADGTVSGRTLGADGRPDVSEWQQQDLLSYKLSILGRILDGRNNVRMARDLGISLTECRVLGHLEARSPRTVRDLADEMLMDKAPVSRAVTNLVSQGYLERRADPSDGRSAFFFLTREGRKLTRAILRNARRGQANYLAQLDPAECRTLLDAIDQLLGYARSVWPEEGDRSKDPAASS
jgi:DNA-binding MarR family transcriptional regulator